MGREDGDPTLQFALRKYRREAGLTQRELAARAGLSVAALRDIEQARRCRPRANSLAALASALNLDPDQAARLGRAAALPRRRPAPAPGFSLEDAHSACAAQTAKRSAGLWLATLGPLEARGDGTPLSLGPPARRAVLGLLLMDPGVLVRRDTMIDVLWGASPPRTAVGLVQAHMSRIRKLLSAHSGRPASEVAIESVGGGYRLALSGQEVDVLVFRKLAGQAAAARAAGDDATAAERYARAVGLWRGDPFADVDVLCGHPGSTALRQELTGVLLRYAEVACALGQHYRVLPRLRSLADAEPLNEPAHAQLMIALARSGQQAAALRVYQDVRSRLDRELGIYPGEELDDTYVRVLRQDTLAGNHERTGALPAVLPPAGRLVPRQLRAGPRSFVGRARELAALSALTESAESDRRQPGGVTMAALTGMAGIGKTALAVYWAHQVADRFPDGQLFVNLRGSGPSGRPLTPTEAVRGFLTGLGVPPMRIPPDTEGQAALYRSLLAGRRMLIVLDNAESAEQIRPLLPGSPGCLVLITSRNRLTGLAAAEGAYLMTLGVLTEAESQDLLASNLDAGRATAEPAAVSELIALCGRLPLALCDVAARAAARPGLPLTALAAEMRSAQGLLNALETGEAVTSVRMVFSWSRARLGYLAARVFRLLAVHPGPDITVPAAASLAGLSLDEAYQAVAELCDEHLLMEYVPGRYTCHNLLRSYAAEEADARETEASRRQAVQRTLDHYLHGAIVASRFLYPGQAEITWTPAQPGVTVENITGPSQAAEWFANERQVLLGVISQAAEDGYAPYAWKLPWIAGRYLQGEACWHRLAAAQEAALVVAQRLNDLAGLVLARQHLGWLRFLLGDTVSAGHHLNEATELAGRVGDRRLQALVGLSLAYVLQAQDRVFEAMVQARQALRLYQAAGDAGGEARALYAIGWQLVQFGDHQAAAQLSSRALMTYCQSLQLARGVGAAMSGLPDERVSPGQVSEMIGRILPARTAAVECFGDDPAAVLYPQEYAAIARATESRQREFATARACARAALGRLGRPPAAVPPGPHGAPQWPDGVTGSITHCAGYRAAVVALTRDVVALGVDAEPNEALPDAGMLELIALAEERTRLRDLAAANPAVCWDRLLFSAKESLYKTWFPLARSWLGFESADIVIDPWGGTFSARLLVPGPVVTGTALTVMNGRWLADRGLLMTAIAVAA